MSDKVERTKSRIKKSKVLDGADESSLQSGVVYIGHLPHGFYENELTGYFSQFGTIKRVRVSRNKKSGRSKGYAFVEFACDEVAKIVAQTMNNYIMFNKLLKCQFVEHNHVHPRMFSHRKYFRREFSLAFRHLRALKQHNKSRTASQCRTRIKRLLSDEKKKRKKLADLGIQYDFPGYQANLVAFSAVRKPSHIMFSQEC